MICKMQLYYIIEFSYHFTLTIKKEGIVNGQELRQIIREGLLYE